MGGIVDQSSNTGMLLEINKMAMFSESTRREFLVQLGGLGVMLAQPQLAFGQQPLPTRMIPGTDESLPVIGLGSSKPVLEIPTEGTEPVAAVIRMLLEHGGRLVDTSPRTPDIDAEFGRVLAEPDIRDGIFLATKINTPSEETGIQQLEQTERLFGRRTIDLVQVESLRGLQFHWPKLQEMKDSGAARYIGVTVSSYRNFDRLEAFMRTGSPDFVHVNYSVIETRAEERILPLAQDLGMGVIINRPFMNGMYFGQVSDRELPPWTADFDCVSWAQFSLKYILAHPAVTCVLTETTNPEHMEENIQAGFGRVPDLTTKQRMREVFSR
ncbi:MAG TPA: aldo/keto reductase [Gemmatimonadetes bacterium]|nr:aldo/keto reductase [Gemmatimonadota bacterium]HIA99089.1 aldo/keto reductase [Gemmatimonadota bacterium]HIC64119.1 aldo/keto reductase [Gemmatimonadota bacterium]